MSKRIIFVIVMWILLIVNNVFSAPAPSYSIKSTNYNTDGYILVGTGISQGSTQLGEWTSISGLGFASFDDLNKEIDNRILGDKLLTDNLNTEIKDRTKADDILQSGIDNVKNDLNNESIVREKADNTLQDNINKEQFDRIAMVNNEAISRQNADNLLQTNINNEAITRYNTDQKLQSNIDNVNSRVDDVSNRVSKLEKTQFGVRSEIKFIREKHLEVGVYNFYSGTRNKVAEVGVNVVIPIGESYLDRENKKINARLDRLEQNLRQSVVITKVVDKKGKQKSISISQGILSVKGEF